MTVLQQWLLPFAAQHDSPRASAETAFPPSKPDLTPNYPTRTCCLARGGRWYTAALTLETATALGQIDAAPEVLAADLDSNWEVLGEAIQTVIRAEVTAGRSSISDPYAALKELTRGKRIGQAELIEFVSALEIGDEAKQRLLALTPATYVGDAANLLEHLGAN